MSCLLPWITEMYLVSFPGMRLKPKGKKSENVSKIRGSAILKEEFSSYKELFPREVIFIHNIPAFFFFNPKPSSDNFKFSHLICLNHKTPINLQKIGNLPKIGKISPPPFARVCTQLFVCCLM